MNAVHSSSALSTMSKAKAAQLWYQLGYKVIPLMGGTKITPLRHGPWLEALSAQAIDVYWSTNPTYDIALHCSTGLVVLDADTPESIAALEALEIKHGVISNLVVQTKKGVHRYYKRSADLLIKAAGHSTENHPERIDIRCDNGYIVAAPSTDKVVLSEVLVPHDQLTEITQVFIDDLLIHNGGQPLVVTPVKTTPLTNHLYAGVTDECGEPLSMTLKIARLRAMLKHIDPEGGYQEVWIPTLMAIKHETNGSDEGLALADEWSRTGASYDGFKSIEYKWNSFSDAPSNPVTMGTLAHALTVQGLDWESICQQADEEIEPFELAFTEIVSAPTPTPTSVVDTSNPFLKYSLLGNLDQVRQNAVEAKPLLGSIALAGQSTVLYAQPNTGKTLVALRLVIDAIEAGRVDPEKVIYANFDDGASGLLTKGEIAQHHGFHQLAGGYMDLTPEKFMVAMRLACKNDAAKGALVVFDTGKKFVDLMDKKNSSEFGEQLRQFTAKGGSVLVLAHVNKNPNSNGDLVPTGVADLPQDVDAVYTIRSSVKGSDFVATFENKKARGPVARTAQYSFSRTERDYVKLLGSVKELTVDESAFEFEAVPQEDPEDRIIRALVCAIQNGFNVGKASLIEEARKTSTFSKSKVEKIHDKYCGSDPTKHHWDFTIKERGVHVYQLTKPLPVEEVELV